MDYPVSIGEEGIKLQPEKMEVDKLYYCIYQDKAMLFFKDKNDLLNCYEIEEKEIVDELKQSKSEDMDDILEKYIEKKNLNH
ncbi:MAG: hypothetical protein KGH89_06500 [Thaumarchaeota archaeon]|nr:hypothetical protein [Nitrososphaerota archaeon]